MPLLQSMTALSLLSTLLLIAQLPIMVLSGYLLMLTCAALLASQHSAPPGGDPGTRLACLVPAHNEEGLLPDLLESFLLQDYPRHLFTLHLIADNCTDRTAEIGRRYGAVVHERSNTCLRGKGHALNWGLERLKNSGGTPDAYLFVDADSVISPNFLKVMDAHYRRGERVVQSYYAVRSPESTWNTGLRQAALAVLHFLRPLGRSALGCSAGLKGNGMLIEAGLAYRFPWSASVTEDIDYHMTLLLNGERVFFAPDAVVWGEMPATFEGSQSQLNRWEQGRVETARRYLPVLSKAAWARLRQGSWHGFFILIDAAMEHLIPPFTILMGLTLVVLASATAALVYMSLAEPGSWAVIAMTLTSGLGFASLGAQILYLLVGLRLVNVPASVYRSFLYAPVYFVRKGGQVLRILLGRGPQEWVKTGRNAAK